MTLLERKRPLIICIFQNHLLILETYLLLGRGGGGIDDGNVEGLGHGASASSRCGSSGGKFGGNTLSRDSGREGRGSEDD